MLRDDYGFPSIDPDLRVCAACFEDEGLKNYVNAHADAQECSFCGATSDDAIAAPLDGVVDHMRTCLEQDYNDPDNAGMVYETAEGGYQGKVWDTYDFVQWHLGLELPNDQDEKLLHALCKGLGDQLWCSAHLYALGPHEALAYSWRTFCSLVKHERRTIPLRVLHLLKKQAAQRSASLRPFPFPRYPPRRRRY